ncbi:phosphotransferase family protein [Bacillus dakarensis]|uniref:phosphotransferase family protein n=1 Tax=Robertmurraya dakarensis TaxID=1926278 RepID=UPI0009FC04EA|nr:phosphotransferase family protein [Bacillus dakarensis]
MKEISKQLAAYLEHRMPGITNVEITELSRIHGGASRETYSLTARWRDGGKAVERPLILRRDPVGSLIETDREVEYNAYSAFYPLGLPVPEPLYIENDPKWLGRPFFVMERIVNSNVSSYLVPPDSSIIDQVGRQFWSELGRIAGADPAEIGLADKLEKVEPENCWKRELTYWENVINEDQLHSEPIARAAIRWLKKNPPPPPPRLSVVHGDYRTGNFLYNDAGDVTAILDWELCHLGDPHEDIAWAADPFWSFESTERPSGMIPREEAFRQWEETSGFTIDPAALRWWEIFSMVKGLAIWISAGNEFQQGTNKDIVLAWSGFFPRLVHNRLLAERLSTLSREVLL